MKVLNKNLIKFLLLCLIAPTNLYANLSDQYKRQGNCSYKNAQYKWIDGTRKKGRPPSRVCIKNKQWILYYIDINGKEKSYVDNPLFSGDLESQVKFGGRVYEYRVEKNSFVRYECRGTTNPYIQNFGCISGVTRKVLAIKDKGEIFNFKKKSNSEKELKVYSREAIAYINRAESLNEFGNYEDAILNLDKVIKKGTTSKYAFYKRGVAKYNFRDYRGAILDFISALDASPYKGSHSLNSYSPSFKKYHLHRMLGNSYYKINQWKSACEELILASKLGDENAFKIDTLKKCLYRTF